MVMETENVSPEQFINPQWDEIVADVFLFGAESIILELHGFMSVA
jgi:hypothetical protein